MPLKIKSINREFSVCKVEDYTQTDLTQEYCFIGKTDEENSLVCETGQVPANVTERDDGWRAFRIEGVLDFSLIGILSKISAILAEAKIGIFAVSTFNTDYILVKAENFEKALSVLAAAGYDLE
ncbi:MAG: ACT domain-containing protein [Lachnospiraceae bacterium]|nr:ACT domain-containing protein [Lachnospiraceae bacterium]